MKRVADLSRCLIAIGMGALAEPSGATAYQYDALHRLTQVAYDTGTIVSYAYDPAGNILSVSVANDADRDGVPDADDAFPLDPNESIDTDGDGIGNNADLDDDDDGSPDAVEALDGTDPLVPDVLLRLRAGLNLIALPIDGGPGLDSAELLRRLGSAAVSISRYDTDVGAFQSTSAAPGDADALFPITADEGYEIIVNAPIDLRIEGVNHTGPRVLPSGPNLVGMERPALSAFELLEQLGGHESTASVSRFNRDTGRYETAVFDGTEPVGIDFELERGEAYWVSRKQ